VDVLGPDGKRSHVERRINASEAMILRRIFALCAEVIGQHRITRTLNAERAIAPRSQEGRPRGWAPTSVHEVLFRDLYGGLITWNRTRQRNQWGQHHQAARLAGKWLEIPAPHLRIVSDRE
jgi:site-specific DNA recombinase